MGKLSARTVGQNLSQDFICEFCVSLQFALCLDGVPRGVWPRFQQFAAIGLVGFICARVSEDPADRSEEHTSELQSLMRISYAVFCLKKKKQTKTAVKHEQ